jgi:hypothetical protein
MKASKPGSPNRATRLAPRVAALLAAAGLACAATMPLPPELKDAEVLAQTGRTRIVLMGKVKPPSLKPYAIADLKAGSGSQAMSAGAVAFASAIGFQWGRVEGGISFHLEKEGAEAAAPVAAQCVWGLATTSGGFSVGKYGSEFKVPTGSSLVCEFLPSPGAEPWKLLLWTGAPTNLFTLEFPSGGVLARGDVRYEADSTNVIEGVGLRSPNMTGTVFRRDGHAVAAVDRMLPGKVLAAPSLPADERSLFVAVGAAIFVYDTQTQSHMH